MYLDIVALIILSSYLVSGLMLGFFVEFISMFGLIGSFYLARYLTPTVMDIANLKLKSENYGTTYVFILITLYIILMLGTHLLNAFFRSQRKGILTRIGGGVIAVAKGSLVVMVLVTGFNLYSKKNINVKKYSEKSITLEQYDVVIPYLYSYIPEEVKTKIDEVRSSKLVDKYIKKIF